MPPVDAIYTAYILVRMTPKATVKVIFNMDKKLKEAAMKKAKKQGITYSAFLNLATWAYVGNKLEFDPLGIAIERARENVRQGKVYTEEQVRRMFKIPPYKK